MKKIFHNIVVKVEKMRKFETFLIAALSFFILIKEQSLKIGVFTRKVFFYCPGIFFAETLDTLISHDFISPINCVLLQVILNFISKSTLLVIEDTEGKTFITIILFLSVYFAYKLIKRVTSEKKTSKNTFESWISTF